VDLLLYAMLIVGAVAGYVARRGRERASRASSRLLDATIYMLIFLVGARSAPVILELVRAGDPKPLVDVAGLTFLPMVASFAGALILGVVLGWTRGGTRRG